jgi:hypothetical protein
MRRTTTEWNGRVITHISTCFLSAIALTAKQRKVG